MSPQTPFCYCRSTEANAVGVTLLKPGKIKDSDMPLIVSNELIPLGNNFLESGIRLHFIALASYDQDLSLHLMAPQFWLNPIPIKFVGLMYLVYHIADCNFFVKSRLLNFSKNSEY
jgi:hypothetical protein